MIDKNTVKKSFSEAAQSYDSNSGLQRTVAEDLVKFLCNIVESRIPACAGQLSHGIHEDLATNEARILDAGCGTGALTRGIKGLLPGAGLCASDIALPMLVRANENLNGAVELVQADCESLPFKDSAFDVVASSLAYQWAAESSSVFSEANRVLKKNGLLVFSTLGPGTLKELSECLSAALPAYASPMTYKGHGALTTELKKAGFNMVAIERRNTVRTYENMRALIKTLKMIGASPPLKGLSIGPALRTADRIYRERYSIGNDVLATYEVIFAAARKD